MNLHIIIFQIIILDPNINIPYNPNHCILLSLNIISQHNGRPYYPTGSVEILAYNFPEAIGSAFSASFIGYPTCQWISQSVYPYHFQELTYQQDIDASKFGPNQI